MTADALRALGESAENRLELWTRFAREIEARQVAEIGVYRGRFAARMLADCPAIEKYYMVDPWRNLEDWDKPANTTDETFERFYREAMERTSAQETKRVVLRGTTTEVIDRVPDASLDLAYVDGDHTLRGITIDLIRVFPKVRPGGWIGGDDFTPSIWQHGDDYEPTLVFPLAVHFAEAVGARIYGLPHKQFLIEKTAGGDHAFTDLTGRYGDTRLRRQFARREEPSLLERLLRRR
jgi:predicted O-methyltransferase YrrM